jgi:hypothetical protein
MSLKHAIASSAAAIILSVSGALWAQTGAQTDAQAAAQTAAEEAEAARTYMRQKIDEATAADDKFHANRTQPNMIARDKAEAEAAEAIKKSQAASEKATAEMDRANAEMGQGAAAGQGGAQAPSPR